MVFSFKTGLKNARSKMGWTQSALCDHYNERFPSDDGSVLEVGKVKKWETGVNVPGKKDLQNLCELFDCDMAFLFGQSDNSTRDIAFICEEIGITEDCYWFLKTIKTKANQDGASSLEYPSNSGKAIRILNVLNSLCAESNYDECFSFWDRLAAFIYTPDAPFRALLPDGERVFSAEEVLSMILSENEQFLRKLRREQHNNG